MIPGGENMRGLPLVPERQIGMSEDPLRPLRANA